MNTFLICFSLLPLLANAETSQPMFVNPMKTPAFQEEQQQIQNNEGTAQHGRFTQSELDADMKPITKLSLKFRNKLKLADAKMSDMLTRDQPQNPSSAATFAQESMARLNQWKPVVQQYANLRDLLQEQDESKIKSFLRKLIDTEREARLNRCIAQLGTSICTKTNAQPFYMWTRIAAEKIMRDPSLELRNLLQG